MSDDNIRLGKVLTIPSAPQSAYQTQQNSSLLGYQNTGAADNTTRSEDLTHTLQSLTQEKLTAAHISSKGVL